jgi:hypothetical protein
VSDTDKICAQLLLDVAEHGRQLKGVGLAPAQLASFAELWAAVAPEGEPMPTFE